MIDLAQFGNFEPEEVLYKFDEPAIFTVRLPSGCLAIAYLADEFDEEDRLRFILSTTFEHVIDDLKSGILSVYDALVMGSRWVVDVDYTYQPVRAFVAIGDDLLPEKNVMLRPDKE